MMTSPVLLLLLLVLVLDSVSSTSTSTSTKLRICSLALALLAPGGAAWGQVGLQLEVGLEGKVRPGQWAPVRVTATNSGAPVAGHIELTVPGARTALPLDLPAAAKKRVEAALIPQLTYTPYGISADEAAASLHESAAPGETGREVTRVQIPIRVLPDSTRLLAVCGEEAGGLRFLDGLSLGETGWSVPLGQQAQLEQGTTVTAHLAPEQMPSEPAGLRAADLLVLRDAAWRQLEPAQRRAVRRWTEMGGRLLICGEDPAGFQDEEGRRLLPVEPAGLRPRAALTAFPLPGREPIRAAAGQVMTIAGRPRPDAVVALREAGAPLVVARPIGFGTVLWVGFDPFRVPPGSRAGRVALWSFLIARATGVETRAAAFPDLADVPAASDPVKRLPHFPAPSRWTLIAFGLVYVMIFGPVNIWLLRRLHRTVRAWLLMPALASLMTGGVLALGTAWGQARVVFHAVSLLETMAGSGTAREQCYAVLFSPTNRTYPLEVDNPTPFVRFLPDEGDDSAASPAGRSGYRPGEGPPPSMPDLLEGDLSRWDRIALTLWTIQPIRADLITDLGDGVRIDLDDRLTGRISNGTPLPMTEAYLQFHGWRFSLGDLAPAAVRPVTRAGWRRPQRAPAGETGQQQPGPDAGEAASGDLLAEAGSLLTITGGRPEVVLVARAPSLAPPLRIPGVPRTPAEGWREGAILLVRKPVSPAAALTSAGAPGNSGPPLRARPPVPNPRRLPAKRVEVWSGADRGFNPRMPAAALTSPQSAAGERGR